MTTRLPRRVLAAACALALCLTPGIASAARSHFAGRARPAACSSQVRHHGAGQSAPVCSGAARRTRRAVRTKAHSRRHSALPRTAVAGTRALGHRRPAAALLAGACQAGSGAEASEEDLQPVCGEVTAAACESAGSAQSAPSGASVCGDTSSGGDITEEAACDGAACPVEAQGEPELACEAGESDCA